MRKVALRNLDKAGGTIRPGPNTKLQMGEYSIALVGDPVDPHSPRDQSAHQNAVMVEGSSRLTVDGIPVVLEGHAASCGHTATGLSNIEVNE